MASLASLKPFLPLIFTFALPRAISFYRTLKTAVRTRPRPRALPRDAARGLNVLFVSACIFLFWSFRYPISEDNVFVVTNSRLHIPTDVLFTRLSLVRPRGILTAFDEVLKTKITSPITRQLYLRFGPSTIVNCSFCHPEDVASYMLYHLSTNILFPHLFHFLALGLATSEPITGFETRRWRNRIAMGAAMLTAIDIYLTLMYSPRVDGNLPSPGGIYWQAKILRPLVLCFFDLLAALVIYASATDRFLLFTGASGYDPVQAQKQREVLLSQTNVALQMAQTKFRAFSVARNAMVREPVLKAVDDEYWRAVVAMEGPTGVDGVWEDEEVQSAISRSLGSGNIDVARMGKEAEMFIANITQGLGERG